MGALATTDLAAMPSAAVDPPLAAPRVLPQVVTTLGTGRGGCCRVGRRRARRHQRGRTHDGGNEVAAASIAAIKAAVSIAAIPPARQRQSCPPQRGSQRQEPPSAENVAAAEIAVEILVIVLAAPLNRHRGGRRVRRHTATAVIATHFVGIVVAA
jgi:hypothetical protein